MKNLKALFSNPFNEPIKAVNETAKVEAQTRIGAKANEIYKDKPFSVEFKALYTVTGLVSVLCNLVSFFTAFWGLNYLLGFTLPSPYLALALSFLIAVIIEVLKNSTFKTAAKQSLKYRQFRGLVPVLFLSILSIALSVLGAYLLPQQTPALNPQNKPFELRYSPLDSIQIREIEFVKSQIAELDNSTKAAQTAKTADGRLTYLASRNLGTFAAQKDSLNSRLAVLNAKFDSIGLSKQKEHETHKLEAQSELYKIQIICASISLGFEVLYILCALFGFYYLYRAFLESELGADGEQAQDEKEPQSRRKKEPLEETPSQKKIGFFASNDLEIFEQDGIKYILHKGKKYTLADCKNNRAANSSKAKKYASLGKADKAQRYGANAQFWAKAVQTLKS